MPATVIKAWSRDYKIPKKSLEKDWDKAETQAKKQGQDKNYAYRMAIFKKMTQKDRQESTMNSNLQEKFGILRKLSSKLAKTKMFQKIGSKAGKQATKGAYRSLLTKGGPTQTLAKYAPGVKNVAKAQATRVGQVAQQRAAIGAARKTVAGTAIGGGALAVGGGAMAIKNRKKKQEDLQINSALERREFVRQYVEIPEDINELMDSLRDDVEEMTVSSNIAVGPPDGPVPAGKKDFKKDKLPGERDKSRHKVKNHPDKNLDPEETTDDERTGHTGIQAGSNNKPIGEAEIPMKMKRTGLEKKDGGKVYADKQKPQDVNPIKVDDTNDTSDAERDGHSGMKAGSGEVKMEADESELLAAIEEMTDEEFESFIGELEEDELEYVDEMCKKHKRKKVSEGEELNPDEIYEAISEMSEEEFDDYTAGLNEEELEELQGFLDERGTNDSTNENIEVYNTLAQMSEEDFNEYMASLSEEDQQGVVEFINEMEEVLPDEIDASNPPKIGSEDEKDQMHSVDTALATPQKKKHTANQIEIPTEA